MSQATTWNTITAGPATMSQVSARVSDSFNAVLSLHSGPSRPSYAVAGTVWKKVVSSTVWELYLYDGSNDILIGTFNPIADTFTLTSTGLGFATSAVMRNDVTPLSLINGRSTFTVGSNGEGIMRLLGRSAGAGDEAAIRFAHGGTDALTFEMIAEASTSLRFRDSASAEFLKLLATGDVYSKLFGTLSEQLVLPGTIILGPFASAPPGWLLANGATISRTTYARLWSYVSTYGRLLSVASWGSSNHGAFNVGNGTTTFGLPSIASEFFRGTVTAGAVGAWVTESYKAHIHGLTDPGHVHGITPNATQLLNNQAVSGSAVNSVTGGASQTQLQFTNATVDSSGGAETAPRHLWMMGLVKI